MNPTTDALVESLSWRERAILTHLAEYKSNREIAALEILALNSVKWYIQQVYTKLGVNRRREAVERALELGLIKPPPTSFHFPISVTNNLPAQLTSFIGRRNEIAELRLLLEKKETRILTLTGSGGTGKTRLALKVASEMLDTFVDGVWFSEIGSLADPLIIPQAVISSLGLIEQTGKTPIAFLIDYLREKRLLLILDNCEHLVEACAELAATLLHSAPNLTILATSREILGVEGEIPFRVPSLAMPPPHGFQPLNELTIYDAVHLFIERARVASPGFELKEENAAAVAQIIQRLDGIPLAIELAAARLRLLSVEQIAQRLNNAFHLLTGGSRTALPRHQTLQALIDWSYNLLSEVERRLFRSLSVFNGGWKLDAAEEVCSGKHIPAQEVLDLSGKLADKSLILVEPAPGKQMRYRMLETVRQYAHARLVEAGEAPAVHARHLDYYLHLAERLELKLRGHEQIAILDYEQSELDNLRLALETALQTDVEAGLSLASALQWFWHIRCHWVEAISWLEKALKVEVLERNGFPLSESRGMIRAKALVTLGFHVLMRDNPVSTYAKPLLEEALLYYRTSRAENQKGLAWALVWLARCIIGEGDLIEARSLAEEALNLFHKADDSHGMAESLQIMGDCEIDPARQKKMYQEQLVIDEANGDVEGIATAFHHIGATGFVDGDYEGACAAFEKCRKFYRHVGNPIMVARNGLLLAIVSHLNGRVEFAADCLEQALTDFRNMGNEIQIAFSLFWKCMIALSDGCIEQATELTDEAERIAQKVGGPMMLTDVLYYRARLARLRGDIKEARRFTEEGLNIGQKFGYSTILELLELGHLELESGELARARELWLEGFQILIRWRQSPWTGYFLDGLAMLAFRHGNLEKAARLFGTWLWRGISHTLSPIERASREVYFKQIKVILGEERFAHLQAEGNALTFDQVVTVAQEEW